MCTTQSPQIPSRREKDLERAKRAYKFATGISANFMSLFYDEQTGEPTYEVVATRSKLPSNFETITSASFFNDTYREVFTGAQLDERVASIEENVTKQTGTPCKFE